MTNMLFSTQMTLFIISIFLLLATPNLATNNSSPLVAQICSNNKFKLDPKLCTQVLQNETLVVTAPNNYLNLSIAIITTGIRRSSATGTHILFLLRNRPNMGAVITCNLCYHKVWYSFHSALRYVQIKDYEKAKSYLAAASIDDIKGCQDSLFSGKIKDQIIVDGNRVVPVLGLAAFEAVDRLLKNSSSIIME